MASNRLKDFVSIVKSAGFVILDTETTGLHNAEIVQIAVIDHNAKTLLDTLVKPIEDIPWEAINVHGIDNDMVVDAPDWAQVWLRVQHRIAGRNVIVYNVAFDRACLFSATHIAGINRVDWGENSEWFCAMKAFAEIAGDWHHYFGQYRWKTLKFAVNHFGGDNISGEHNALADCRHTLFVSEKIAFLDLS